MHIIVLLHNFGTKLQGEYMAGYLMDVAVDIRQEIENNFMRNSKNLKHRGLIGTSHEVSIMREFFRNRMPFYGICGGEIVASNGFRSKQTDIILYDKDVTPLFFSVNSDIQVIPIEGVLATVEVKTFLNRKELHKAIMASCEIKENPKTAFWGKTVEKRYNWYGIETNYFPVITCIIANDSVGLNTIANILIDEYKNIGKLKGLNFIYIVKKGLIYIDLEDSKVSLIENLNDAAFMFYTQLHNFLSLAYTPRIRIHDYAGDFLINRKFLNI